MRVLVTGSTGYIGRVVTRELRLSGHEPVALASRLHETLVADGVDGVVHLAALARVRESFEQPLRYYDVNVNGTLNLLKALSGQRFVLASTGSVYGTPAEQPITEDFPRAPASPYAASKATAEDLVSWTARAGQIGAATLRFFNAAGGGDTDDSRVITKAVGVASGRLPRLEVFGDGSAVRDFVHVKDIARAVVTALENCSTGRYDVFNVGATPASVRDVISSVERVTGQPVPLLMSPANPGEARELRADTTRLRALGWKPESSSLDEIVSDQWAAETA